MFWLFSVDLDKCSSSWLMIVFSSNGFSSWKFPIRDSPNDIVNPSHRQKRFTIKRVLKRNGSWWLVVENYMNATIDTKNIEL